MKNTTQILFVALLMFGLGCGRTETARVDSPQTDSTVDSEKPGYTKVPAVERSLAEIVEMVNSGKATLIDVREQSEWDEKSFKMAKLVPMSKISAGALYDLGVTDKGAPLIIYTHCAKGFRAKKVADSLLKDGVPVLPLEYSFEELEAAGFELNGK